MAFRRTLLPRLAAFSALILLATCQETPQIDSQAATALVGAGRGPTPPTPLPLV
jgi:hypothetical protein